MYIEQGIDVDLLLNGQPVSMGDVAPELWARAMGYRLLRNLGLSLEEIQFLLRPEAGGIISAARRQGCEVRTSAKTA